MMTRQAKVDKGKARKGKMMKGIVQFKVYDNCQQLLLQAEADFSPEMEKKSKPGQHVGAKRIIPHLVCSYTNSNVDASIGRKEQGEYETALLSL